VNGYDFFVAAAFFTFAGLLLPNEPLKIFPFFVFLSPFPINIFFAEKIDFDVIKKAPSQEQK
jgi:hypothetical protein